MRNLIKDFFSVIHEKITGVHPPHGFTEAFFIYLLFLIAGTLFYSFSEGWSFLDSLYFSVSTLSTVGYGDMHPTSSASKIFTIFYIFAGVGLALFVVSSFSKSVVEGRENQMKKVDDLMRTLERKQKGETDKK